MPIDVILDTDIGTDVDDCLALALILASPELRLRGVTCVYGDVELRARMVTKLLRLRDETSVPVMAGMRQPLMNKRPVYWAGHEGNGLLTRDDQNLRFSSEFAIDFLARIAQENPGQIHLIAIGPLTNVAMALMRDPHLPLAQITLMGGVIRGAGSLNLPYAEHNIICDPEAAHVVFSSGIPTHVIPLDLTTQVRIYPEGVRRIRSGKTPFHDAVATQVELYPNYRLLNTTFTHDPLAVATLIDPSLVQFQPVHVDVELAGQYTTGATLMRADDTSRVQVGVSVDAPRFEEFLIARLQS